MITVRQPRLVSDRVVGEIEAPFGLSEVWYHTGDVKLVPSLEAIATVALPVAMAIGEPLVCDGAVSGQWYAGQQRIQQVLAAWYKELRPVTVAVSGLICDRPSSPSSRSAAFFSGGVDSFSTVLRQKDQLSGLVLMNGFDIPLGRDDLWAQTRHRMTAAARALGLPLSTVSTNLRSFLNRVGKWGELTHGAALASVAIVQGQFQNVYVPSSHSYTDLFPWGSHPLLDPWWSTERVTLIHDGAEFTRLEKTAHVAASPAAMEHLRVCWQNSGEFNCGTCEKCIRTQCALVVCGARDDITFPRPVTPARVRRLWFDENSISFAREIANSKSSHPIAEAVREAIWRHEFRRHIAAAKSLATSSSPHLWRWLIDKATSSSSAE